MKGIRKISSKPLDSKEIKFYKIYSIFMYICWGIILAIFLYNYTFVKYQYPLKYKTEVVKNCEEFELNKCLVYAIIKEESSFNPNALSEKGAIGLMQIKNETASYIAEKQGIENYDIYNPETNIYFGCFYLKYLFNKFENNETVLAAYNAGEGNVSKWLLNKDYSSDGKSLSIVPFEETKNYIEKVKKSLIRYTKYYSNILDKK